ncbi:casein kinase I [Friedmanniomyces endolithicus]|nr:casein kinase I [Friedmanniomyces endolithicus]
MPALEDNKDQSPKDDLETLGYMMAFFARGRLPWQGLQAHGRGEKNRAVVEKKMATLMEQLCEELPEEFAQYMQEVKDILLEFDHIMTNSPTSSEDWL